ncbi:uncharacterized protein LOC134929192 [Pseudophryne corroboree]|uniref:uncharacterized protein LOC134929192 n=2 Tax=Pseudophryne corroboree TaxID=495146 RepID=UPI003081B4AF
MKVTPLRSMEDFIRPPNFFHVVHAVRSLAGYDDKTNTYRVPSLALKVGHSLQKISAMVECQALMEGSALTVESARSFRKLYEARWSELISTAALKTLREIKWNAPLLLPFTDDVKRLNLYLLDRQREYLDGLSAHPSPKQWSMLAKVTLTQLILFNRRREGEVSKMRLSSFESRHTADLQGDVAQALSEMEKALCHHFTRIEIPGKRGRKVPILLSPCMQKAMEILTEKRAECGVTPENFYMFARPAALSHFRGSDCIRLYARECGAKHPEALSSTRLRKHVATLSRVLNLSDTEMDQLADFLGHDIRVHRQYYRLPEGTLQLAKLSKLFVALEQGRMAEFRGRSLEEISIDPDGKYHWTSVSRD